MEIVLYILIIIVGVMLIFLKQKVFSLILITIGSLLFLISIINLLTSKSQLILSNQLLDKVSKINWSNENELKSFGFQKFGKEYVLYLNNTPNRLVVTPEFDVTEPVIKYGDVLYYAEERTLGKFDIKRLWNDNIPVYRRYYFIIDNVKISTYEDAFEGDELCIENIMSRLASE